VSFVAGSEDLDTHAMHNARFTCDIVRALNDQLHLVFCYLRVLHNGLLAYGLQKHEIGVTVVKVAATREQRTRKTN
jgi:hypothetical protein